MGESMWPRVPILPPHFANVLISLGGGRAMKAAGVDNGSAQQWQEGKKGSMQFLDLLTNFGA